MDEIMEQAAEQLPIFSSQLSGGDNQPTPKDGLENVESVVEDPEEAGRAASIEESRRKLAELERDRPLWESAAREREQREREEETQRRAKAEQRRREAEETERARARAAAQERKREEAARRAHEAKEAERQEREKRAHMQRERWAYGPWTEERALERYRQLCGAFDERKFGPGTQALTFTDIPWPTLRAPLSFGVEDIDWGEVEAFFAAARSRMRFAEYTSLVQKSHRRFHPDRWRSRGVLAAVTNESERCAMEVAANTVAQALTPLWRETKAL